MEADRCEARPIGWILEQLSGQPNVVCGLNFFYYYIVATYIYPHLRKLSTFTPRIPRIHPWTLNTKE
jgi:hypothetical protein